MLNSISLYIRTRKKYFFINTKYSMVFFFYIHARKKYFFVNAKYSTVFLFYIHARKKYFFINTECSIIFLFIYAQEKNIFLSTQIFNSISLLYIRRKKINFFYSHKAVNDFECFSLIKITHSFLKPDLIELFY